MLLESSQVFTILVTIIGAGFTSYVGVKVALAEMRENIKSINKDLTEIDSRVKRLESPFFDKRQQS